MLLLDLDNFKVINDSLGHRGGDELLRALTPRLQAVARDGDTVARLGGDEFALVCEGIISEEHALELSNRVVAALTVPFKIGQRRHAVKASIGVVVDDGCSSPARLLRDADTAMHRAKERGGGCVERFSAALRERVVARMRTESELHGAIERNELRLHYQPFFSIPDRRLLGVEALVRWQHPQRGLVPPLEFIPLAEQTGLIVELGAWVLGASVQAMSDWRAAFPCATAALTLSVNVSARQLLAASDGSGDRLHDIVKHVLTEAQLPPQRLALEITESMLMEAGDEPESVLYELQRLGVEIMLDDFGTGHSSLSRLSDFPLDVVKIDRCFVSGLGRDGSREPIVTAIIAMARALNLQVIAEGVETEDEWRRLVALGCEAAQGYALARPMSPEQLTALLAGGSADSRRRHAHNAPPEGVACWLGAFRARAWRRALAVPTRRTWGNAGPVGSMFSFSSRCSPRARRTRSGSCCARSRGQPSHCSTMTCVSVRRRRRGAGGPPDPQHEVEGRLVEEVLGRRTNVCRRPIDRRSRDTRSSSMSSTGAASTGCTPPPSSTRTARWRRACRSASTSPSSAAPRRTCAAAHAGSRHSRSWAAARWTGRARAGS